MNTVLLQSALTPHEIAQLAKEFPQYQFLSSEENVDWSRVEILYGNSLTPQELAQAHALHWVHSSSLQLDHLCLDKLIECSNILVTTPNEEDITQKAEFVMSGILAFAKHLFHWHDRTPDVKTESLCHEMWSMPQRTLLQIGLGTAGTEIARLAQRMNLQVWGVQPTPSFHPYCHKTIATHDFRSVFPVVDIICLCLPKRRTPTHFLSYHDLLLMKEDSILIILGSHIVREEDLAAIATMGKLRGIILDDSGETPISPDSPLRKIPNLLITPGVSCCPVTLNKQIFRCFHFNLRQYSSGNFVDMRNRIDREESVMNDE